MGLATSPIQPDNETPDKRTCLTNKPGAGAPVGFPLTPPEYGSLKKAPCLPLSEKKQGPVRVETTKQLLSDFGVHWGFVAR